METEDTEVVDSIPGPEAAGSDTSYADVLSAEGTDAKDSPVSEPEATEKPEANPEVDTDPVITLKEGMQAKLSEILEWQKGAMLQKDYTQKTQALAEDRKSLEVVKTAFGGKLPDPQSIQNMGVLFQKYFSDERAAQMIDAVLSGNYDQALQGQTQPQQQGDPYIKTLESKISGLENQLRQFTGSFEQREQARLQAEAKQTWDGWVAKRQATDKGFVVSEEIDTHMGALIPSVHKLHPDWDDHKVLDHAYRLATIDKQPQKIAQNILKDADQAKKGNPPKINQQSGKKSLSDLSYTDLLNE